MSSEENYLEKNRQLWNSRTEIHLKSEFYDVEGFLKGKSSLNEIELKLLGDINGKSILHLQCHFGQDSISLSRLGAKVTGVDLSDKAIDSARQIAKDAQSDAAFVCCDIYDLPNHLNEKFDIVFTSYGTIGWLPDLDRWAKVIAHFLKPNGRFIIAEFHPFVWMYDNNFEHIAYSYFKAEAIVETEDSTYADTSADIHLDSITWNHSLSEVMSSLLKNGMQIDAFEEYDYSPYNCFNKTIEFEPGKFRIEHFGNKIPMVYAMSATKISTDI